MINSKIQRFQEKKITIYTTSQNIITYVLNKRNRDKNDFTRKGEIEMHTTYWELVESHPNLLRLKNANRNHSWMKACQKVASCGEPRYESSPGFYNFNTPYESLPITNEIE
jgi:hypothetical protein